MLDNAFYVDGATGVTVVDLGSNAGVSGATISLSNLTVPAGVLIVVLTAEATSGSAGTLADGGSNTWSTATSGAMSGAAGFGTFFYVANCNAINNGLITYTRQTSGRSASLTAFYVTGIATSTPLDTAVTATTAVNSATPTVTSGTPTQSGNLVIGACAYGNASSRTLTNTGAFVTPFANQTTQATASTGGGHINVSGALPVTFTPTLSAACDNRTMIVGFKLANLTLGGWWNVTQWANKTAAAGEIIRQATTPAVGSERVFVCTTAGATGATEPTWTTTRGALNTSSSAVYQEATGVAALNGDLTNTPTWAQMRAASTTATLGQVIQRNSGASYQICTIQGTVGASEPVGFSNTAGVTTADNTATWTSLGVVGNFTTIFAAPFARLAPAYVATWGAASNSFFVHSTHAEIQTTAITLTSPGAAGTACNVYSVGTGAVPPTSVTAGATIRTAGNVNITVTGNANYDGVSFAPGNAAGTATLNVGTGSGGFVNIRNGSLTMGSSGSGSRINLGDGSTGVGGSLYNVPLTFSNTGQRLVVSGAFTWLATASAIGGAVFPTTLMQGAGSVGANVLVEGVDLSALGANRIIDPSVAGCANSVLFQDVQLNASAVLSATQSGPGGMAVDFVRCGSGAVNYVMGRQRYEGVLTTDIVTVRTGGASAGVPISWKVVPTANAKWTDPFPCPPIRSVINSRLSQNVTATLRGTWSGGAVPTNKDCWMAIEYLGTSGQPLGVFNSGTVASNLVSSSPQTADTTSVWGAGGTTNFQMVTTLSAPQPLIAGYFNVYIFVGANSGTFYFDPLVSLT